MNDDWMSDARKIPDDVMNYIRRLAVHAVVDHHQNVELIASIFRISRTSLYTWLKWCREDGDQALDTRKAPGAAPIITPKIELWLKRTILRSTPAAHGFDTALWTLKILAALLKKTFEITVYESTIWNHLRRLGLSCQVPQYRSDRYDSDEVEHYLNMP